jgi:hypothetical protein
MNNVPKEATQGVNALQTAAHQVNGAANGNNVKKNLTGASNNALKAQQLLAVAARKTDVPAAKKAFNQASNHAKKLLIVRAVDSAANGITAIVNKANKDINKAATNISNMTNNSAL